MKEQAQVIILSVAVPLMILGLCWHGISLEDKIQQNRVDFDVCLYERDEKIGRLEHEVQLLSTYFEADAACVEALRRKMDRLTTSEQNWHPPLLLRTRDIDGEIKDILPTGLLDANEFISDSF